MIEFFFGPLFVALLITLATPRLSRLFHFRAAVSLEWPNDLTSDLVSLYTEIYLSSAGWTLLPLASDRKGICVRAENGRQRLEIFVPQRATTSLATSLKDADNIAVTCHCTVVFVAHGFHPDEVASAHSTRRVLIIYSKQLETIEELLHLRYVSNKNAMQRGAAEKRAESNGH